MDFDQLRECADSDNPIATAARLGAMLGAPVYPSAMPQGKGLAPYAIIPSGADLVALPIEPERPGRHSGSVALETLASFCRYIEHVAEALPAPIIYASEGNPPITPASIVAVMDDHTAAGLPGRREFRATFAPTTSPEFIVWLGRNSHQFGQIEFAQFIEENIASIAAPTGAQLLEMILNFEATKNAEFRSAARLEDGSVNFAWIDAARAKDGGNVRLPASLLLRLPVFIGRPPIEIQARLRFRVNDARLSIWYELPHPPTLMRAEFSEIVAELEQHPPAGAVVVRGRIT